MPRWIHIVGRATLLLAVAVSYAGADQSTAPQGMSEMIRRIIASEDGLVERMRAYHPLVETYIQTLVSDEQLGAVPREDDYFLGKLDLSKGLKTSSLIPGHGVVRSITGALRQPFPLRMRYVLDSFAAMALLDAAGFTEARYEFRFVRREFLGEARCLVFDIRPQGKKRDGFMGRIWVEDRDYTIVRLNGANSTLPGFLGEETFHFDSWRVHIGPGVWLPAYIYSEEADLGRGLVKPRKSRFKAQTRLWGYDLHNALRADEFTALNVTQGDVSDRAPGPDSLSPVQSQRSWELQAEQNVIERLEKAGLVAPAGDVDRVLATVVNNLEITNELNLETPVRCRVLITSPLESFTIGRTIVLSRGLVDVLPDEATLATMLAHELAHIVLGHPLIDTKWAFADRMQIDDTALLESFRFGRKPNEETAADTKAVEMLRRSPYNDKLGDAGLFLRLVASRSRQLQNLIRPHFGDRLARGADVLRLGEMAGAAPKLELAKKDQIAALPLGGRIQVDPWSGRLELLKTKSTPLASAREKMPLEVTPFMPYLSYRQTAADSAARTAAQNPGK